MNLDSIISPEIYTKYHMMDLESFCERHEEIDWYKTFLIQTDHIAYKIAESAYLNEETDKDYTPILEARKYCRQKINELEAANAL